MCTTAAHPSRDEDGCKQLGAGVQRDSWGCWIRCRSSDELRFLSPSPHRYVRRRIRGWGRNWWGVSPHTPGCPEDQARAAGRWAGLRDGDCRLGLGRVFSYTKGHPRRLFDVERSLHEGVEYDAMSRGLEQRRSRVLCCGDGRQRGPELPVSLSRFGDPIPATRPRLCSHRQQRVQWNLSKKKVLGEVRHLEVAYLWLQNLSRKVRIMVKKILGQLNPADLMTKYLIGGRTISDMEKLGFAAQDADRYTSHVIFLMHLAHVFTPLVAQGVSVRVSFHPHAIHDVMCLSVRWSFLVSLSPVSLLLLPLLFLILPVLCRDSIFNVVIAEG